MNIKANLTKRQREILSLTLRILRENGLPPTLKELGERLKISPPTVMQHLDALKKKGFLSRERGRPRGLRVLGEDDRQHVNVPVIGAIAAGQPILAVQDQTRVLRLPRQTVRDGREIFALKVKGNSMKDAAIVDGDYIIVRRQNTAVNGDIVVALLDGSEATVKRFCKRRDGVYLVPANDELKPIRVPGDGLLIQGKVVAVHRHLSD